MAESPQLPSVDLKSADASHEPPTASEIEAWLVSYISGAVNVSGQEVDIRLPFTYFGISSAAGVILAGDLERWLGRSLPATLAWDYPTIETLARFLASDTGGFEPPPASAEDAPAETDEIDRILTGIEQLPEAEAQALLEEEKTKTFDHGVSG